MDPPGPEEDPDPSRDEESSFTGPVLIPLRNLDQSSQERWFSSSLLTFLWSSFKEEEEETISDSGLRGPDL